MVWKKTITKTGLTGNLKVLRETNHFRLSQLPDGCFFMHANQIYLKTAYFDRDDCSLCFAIATGLKFDCADENPVVLLIVGTITIGSNIIPLD